MKNNENRTVLCKIKIETSLEYFDTTDCENKTMLIEPYSTITVTANNLYAFLHADTEVEYSAEILKKIFVPNDFS